MSYQINKTNGTLLVNLVDGQVDRNSTNLVLVGKNYTGFGEFINENFVKILENFSNTAAPSNPLEGQLWWDTTEQKIKVYNGISWKNLGVSYGNSSQINKFEGDVWFDSLTKQLFAFDGSQIILIGPEYSQLQGKSGFEVATVSDAQGVNTVIKLYVGTALVAVISNKEFTPVSTQRIQELVNENNPTGIIYKGINVVENTFNFIGTATSSRGIVDSTGVTRRAADFISSRTNSTTVGTITIQNSGGLRIGTQSNAILSISQNRFDISNETINQNFAIKVKDNTGTLDAVYVNTANKRVGIFNSNPQYALDVSGSQQVSGDLTIGGNLIVRGETLQVSVSELTVQGNTIELNTDLDGAGTFVSNNSTADGGGIILRSSEGDKSIRWQASGQSWTANQSINISSFDSPSYKINGNALLTPTSVLVSSAPNLTSIGKLSSLTVGTAGTTSNDVRIENKSITSNAELLINPATFLVLNPAVSVILNNKKITELGNPENPQDAATKSFVEKNTLMATEVLTMDVTGLGSGNTLRSNIANILTELIPPTADNVDKIVKILTVSHTVAVSNINVDAAKNVSTVLVDSNGTQNQLVVRDITFNSPATAQGVFSSQRRFLTYRHQAGTGWLFVTETVYTPSL